MTVTSDGSKLVVGLAVSPYIKLWTYSGGWTDASSVAGSGAVTDLITAGGTLYGVRNKAVISSTDGNSWSTVGSYNTAVGVAYVNEDLWVGGSTNTPMPSPSPASAVTASQATGRTSTSPRTAGCTATTGEPRTCMTSCRWASTSRPSSRTGWCC